jgi:hypothetical protein
LKTAALRQFAIFNLQWPIFNLSLRASVVNLFYRQSTIARLTGGAVS